MITKYKKPTIITISKERIENHLIEIDIMFKNNPDSKQLNFLNKVKNNYLKKHLKDNKK